MNRIKIECDIVCSNCFLPIGCVEHDGHNPMQIAVGFCNACVEEKIKSAIEAERRRIHKILQDSENA